MVEATPGCRLGPSSDLVPCDELERLLRTWAWRQDLTVAATTAYNSSGRCADLRQLVRANASLDRAVFALMQSQSLEDLTAQGVLFPPLPHSDPCVAGKEEVSGWLVPVFGVAGTLAFTCLGSVVAYGVVLVSRYSLFLAHCCNSYVLKLDDFFVVKHNLKYC